MLWSVDSNQNSVSADQYCLNVLWAQVSTHWVRVFFEIIRWQLTTFQMIAGSSSFFFKCMWNTLCSWVAPLKFWFQNDLGRENSAEFCMQSLFTSLTMVTSWSRSSSNFYTLIGQNFAGEFMRKMYAASGTCFLIAEADRVLCRQLVVFLTVFFQWIYKMNTAGIKILL